MCSHTQLSSFVVISVRLSLSRSAPLPASVVLSVSVPLSLSVCSSLSLCVCSSLSLCLFLSLSLPHSVCVCFSVSLCLSVSLSVYLCLVSPSTSNILNDSKLFLVDTGSLQRDCKFNDTQTLRHTIASPVSPPYAHTYTHSLS